jgi:hypothetical protein
MGAAELEWFIDLLTKVNLQNTPSGAQKNWVGISLRSSWWCNSTNETEYAGNDILAWTGSDEADSH